MKAIYTLLSFALLTQLSWSCSLDGLVDWAATRIQSLGGCTKLSAGAEPVSYQMRNVKLFLYQRDDHETLSDFLQYHSYVFGFKNIIVFDQRSELEPICKTLALFQHCGITVITNTGSLAHRDKGSTLTGVMKQYRPSFLIPLDSDEFIMPFAHNATSNQVRVDRDALHSAFQELHVDGRKYKFQHYSTAVPKTSTCVSSIARNESEFRRVVQSDMYFPVGPPVYQAKTFFHSRGFISTDDGNHFGSVKHDEGKTNNHPAVLHNMTHYFSTLRAQMVHFSVGGYRGAHDKFTRAATHIGFTADSNCSQTHLPAYQYCRPAKLFINGSDHGARFYTNMCHNRWKRLYHFTAVSEWFKNHTLSLAQLTGMQSLFNTTLKW